MVFKFVRLLSTLAAVLQKLIICCLEIGQRYELATMVIAIFIIILIIMSVNGSRRMQLNDNLRCKK